MPPKKPTKKPKKTPKRLLAKIDWPSPKKRPPKPIPKIKGQIGIGGFIRDGSLKEEAEKMRRQLEKDREEFGKLLPFLPTSTAPPPSQQPTQPPQPPSHLLDPAELKEIQEEFDQDPDFN